MKDILVVASSVYFGRSGHPERRLLEHREDKNLDYLLVTHWAASWPEIRYLETELINRFSARKWARVQNQSAESDGRLTAGWNCLYVAFRLKAAFDAIPGYQLVRRLDWRHRAWPTSGIPFDPVLLRTMLTSPDASAELARFKALNKRGGAPMQGLLFWDT